jgi:vanillate O-demethylase ferredoxin subunit
MTSNSGTLSVRIVQKRLEAEDVVSLRLRGMDGPLPPFEPGAHVDLEIAPNVLRQYSLCGLDSDANEYEIAVLREPNSRGGSKGVHDALQVGQVIQISPPRNHFPLEDASGRILLFAGGIGVTPIMAMAEWLAAKGRPFEMHYCARSQDRMAYRERVLASADTANVHVHFDVGPAEQQVDIRAVLGPCGPGDHVYVCGPGGFIEAALCAGRELGWPDEQLHREFFAAPAGNSDQGENSVFTVAIGSSGLRFEVPVDRSIAEVLEENGIFVPTSCAEGICGTCVVNVLEGQPDHRDFLFSEAEHAANDKMTTCCSRSKSKILVLDL